MESNDASGVFDLEGLEVVLPELGKLRESGVHLGEIPVLVDGRAGGRDLLFLSERSDDSVGGSGGESARRAQESGNIVPAIADRVAQALLEQGEGPRVRTHFVVAEELPAIRFEARHGLGGGDVVDAEVPLHERVLLDDDVARGFRVGSGGHGLGHPVGVGQVHERIEVGELVDGDDIHPSRGTGVLDADVLEEYRGPGGNEHRDLDLESFVLHDPTAVGQTDVTLPRVHGNESRCDEGRNDLGGAVLLSNAEVDGRSLEIRARHPRQVLGEAVERWVSLADERSPSGVHDAPELQRAHVVAPLDGGGGVGDDIFLLGVVEVAVLGHGHSS